MRARMIRSLCAVHRDSASQHRSGGEGDLGIESAVDNLHANLGSQCHLAHGTTSRTVFPYQNTLKYTFLKIS